MAGTSTKLITAVETYFADLKRIHVSGGGTKERSSYGPLINLLNAVGATLKPKVFCIGEIANQGAGHPDLGLYAVKQIQRSRPRKGQAPEHGVVEVKAVNDDIWLTAKSDQVSRYWGRYRLVLVTNTRDFVLVGDGGSSKPSQLEAFRLADGVNDFYQQLEEPRSFAREVGAGFSEYLARALSHRAILTEPRDLAWLLASYARDALARVEAAGNTPSLEIVCSALENALGVKFESKQGQRLFHSTLVQTLFYGIFSAWVLWSRSSRSSDGPLFDNSYGPEHFNWREAAWHLRAPVLRALFQQISDPGRLQPLGLVEVLDWTEAALDRVDQLAFFSKFTEGEAVPYFYEPFLEAFDPNLRKQLGVWYTPAEVVRYMVARVDKALKDDLDIPEGLAAENVYVLDPCCGTGAYLAEVLNRIATNLENQGLGALAGVRVKRAAIERVFGFEIMPAPFVVAHLQVGLTLQNLDASLTDDGTERASVFLTNALTGWEPHTNKSLPFPELEEERDRAEQVKQKAPILVILGNPPYNGFAGMTVGEEKELSKAYRSTMQVKPPKGQGLNDLYIRFFRTAERRIAEKTGQGVICFISNYSWLDGLSFTGMREHYLEAFDAIRIDCLNGDKYKTGKTTPDGSPDPSIFSTESNPVGIQVGTAITTLIRKAEHSPISEIGFRHLWGQTKPEQLSATAEIAPDALYKRVEPILPLGLPFVPTAISDGWFDWPSLPELFPMSFPGIKTSRDGFLVDIDLNRLRTRVNDYFDARLNHEEIAQRYPAIMKTSARFDARAVRNTLLKRGGPSGTNFIRFSYRPFDNRWLYWEDSDLLDRSRPEYKPHVFEGNLWLCSAQHLRKDAELVQACFTKQISSLHLIERGAHMFPSQLGNGELGSEIGEAYRPNLSRKAQNYLDTLGLDVESLFYYVLAILHEPAYLEANAGALQMEWPRIPLPNWPDAKGNSVAHILRNSAERGRTLATLLDPDTGVLGVTQNPLRPEIAAIAIPSTMNKNNMADGDFSLTAGWGHWGAGDAVMPGQGYVVERNFRPKERAAMSDALPTLGKTTFDVYLNENAFLCNVPAAVWAYNLGGYQVLKKWLSYREYDVLARPLSPEEIQHFTDIARRIGAILLATSTISPSEVS